MRASLWVGIAVAASTVMVLGCVSGDDGREATAGRQVPDQARGDANLLNATLLALIPSGRDVGAELIKIGKQAAQTGVTITDDVGHAGQ